MRKDARENRARILSAARAVFAKRGLRATMHDIADHAGVGVGTVYRHFPGKAPVVEAVFEEEIERVVRLAERAMDDGDPWSGFQRFFLEVAGELACDRGLQEVVLAGSLLPGVVAAQNRLRPTVGAVVQRAQDAGALRADVDPADFPLIGRMLCSVSNYARDTRPDLWRRYASIVLDGLRPQRDSGSPLLPPALSPEEFGSLAGTGGNP